jgi:hypothetical protein
MSDTLSEEAGRAEVEACTQLLQLCLKHVTEIEPAGAAEHLTACAHVNAFSRLLMIATVGFTEEAIAVADARQIGLVAIMAARALGSFIAVTDGHQRQVIVKHAMDALADGLDTPMGDAIGALQ